MKLIFTKNSTNEISVQLQKGTIAVDFNYTEMIKQLLICNTFEDSDFHNVTEDEQEKIADMLSKITNVFKEEVDTTDDEEL